MMKLFNFRTFLVLFATFLFVTYFTFWKFSEKPAYSFVVQVPKAYNPNFTDAELWEYVESGQEIQISEFNKRNLPIPHYDKFLIVSLEKDKKLKINRYLDFGNLDNTIPLTKKLSEIFHEREQAGVYEPNSDKIIKAVIVKALRSAKYGEVIKVVDAVKTSGADPIILQIDELPE